MKNIEELGVTSIYIDNRGYVICRGVGGRRKVRLHRLVMERHLGRKLLPTEDVHHKDGDKTNNDISNLEVIEHGAHSTISGKSRVHPKGYKLKLSKYMRERRREWAATGLKRANRQRFLARAALAEAAGESEAR